jgi:hypothetical protein
MKYILIIMLFSSNGGVHSQQIVMSSREACVKAATQLDGSPTFSTFIKAVCIDQTEGVIK